MPVFERHAEGVWTGDLRGGSGTASTGSGALRDAPVTFVSRFENAGGSNPEELVAAAHASCFSMQLSANLGRRGYQPEEVRTQATITLELGSGGPRVTQVHLETEGRVPGIEEATFREAAEEAKLNCPISKLLTPGLDEVSLEARLVS
ncbi:MAG TPA: OsmC family protein [Ardenticatenaceae bacterium]|nr:OsmC family protein [Ardenticatenaceae bacterium]